MVVLATVLGTIVSYGVIYLLGNYVQADTIAELENVMGANAAKNFTNNLYGNALKYSVAVIAATSIALKLRTKT